MRGITTQLTPQILFQNKSQGKLKANRGDRNKAQTDTLASTVAANSKHSLISSQINLTLEAYFILVSFTQ